MSNPHSPSPSTLARSLGAPALSAALLLLAGGSARATGYVLVVDPTGYQPLNVEDTGDGKSASRRFLPDQKLAIEAGHRYAFQFRHPIGPGGYREVAFDLFMEGRSGRIARFRYGNGGFPVMSIFFTPEEGLLELQKFKGKTSADEDCHTWRGGQLEWVATEYDPKAGPDPVPDAAQKAGETAGAGPQPVPVPESKVESAP